MRAAQLAIVTNCAKYVKRGGALYYATCSLFEEENDGIVGEFLRGREDFSAERLKSPLPHEEKAHGIQFLPDTAFGAGFYVAKMRRA